MQCSGKSTVYRFCNKAEYGVTICSAYVGKDKHEWLNSQMISPIPRPPELHHRHRWRSWDWLQNWCVTEGKFYWLHQKLMRTLSYSIFNLSAKRIITSNLPSHFCQGLKVNALVTASARGCLRSRSITRIISPTAAMGLGFFNVSRQADAVYSLFWCDPRKI